MMFLDIFKKLKKNKEYNYLVSPQNIYSLPKRIEFNQEELIKEKKKEYLKILSNVNYTDVLALECEKLNEDVKRTTDLLINMFYKYDINNLLAKKEYSKYFVNYEKIKLYLKDLNDLYSEVIARIYALKELKPKYVLKRVRNTLNNTLDRLYIIYNIILTQEGTLRQLLISFTSIYEDMNNVLTDLDYEMSQEDKEIKHLNWLQEILPLDNQVNIKDKKDYKNIAILEKNLENYAYLNKQEIIKESKKEIIDKSILENIEETKYEELLIESFKQKIIDEILKIPFTYENKELLLKKITDLEKQYRLFYEYGRNFITESDLAQVYSLKFSALILSPTPFVDSSIFKNEDEIAKENYEKCLNNMFEDIIMGRNKNFNQMFQKNLEEAINTFKGIFKMAYHIDKHVNMYAVDTKEFISARHILDDYDLFNLLYTLDSGNSLEYFFYKIRLKISMPKSLVFNFAKELPLTSIWYIKEATEDKFSISFNGFTKDQKYIIDEKYYNLYKLYQKSFLDISLESFDLPEGITKIDYYGKSTEFDQKLINKIRQDSEGKKVFLPKDLKVLGQISSIVKSNKIILNNELEQIKQDAIKYLNIPEIDLPSSLKKIEKYALNTSFLEKITININKNNQKLLEYDNLKNIFSSWIYQLFNNEAVYLKGSLKYLIIHIEEINYDFKIDIKDLIFPINPINKNNYEKIGETYICGFITGYIDKKFQDLKRKYLKMQLVLPKEEQINIRNFRGDLLRDLEVLDSKLRKYALENKDKAEDMKSYVDKLVSLFLADKIDQDVQNNLSLIEAQCLLFNHYGLVSTSILDSFYTLKYLTLTDKSNKVVEPLIKEDTLDYEITTYVMEMDCILEKALGRCTCTDEILKLDPITELIFKILKIKEGKINNYKEILSNVYYLNLFLSLEDPLKLIDFINYFKISSDNLSQDQEKIFTFTKNMPLGSLVLLKNYLRLKNENKIITVSDFISSTYKNQTFYLDKDFFELYHLVYLKYYNIWKKQEEASLANIIESRNYYYLPEGIETIDATQGYYSNKDFLDIHLLNDIAGECINKIIVMPDSLKIVKGPLFYDIKFQDVVLNEGLETLDLSIFYQKDIPTMTIPSTVKNILCYFKPHNYNFKKIVFNNFNKDNIEVLKTILSYFIYETFKDCYESLIETLVFHDSNCPDDIIIDVPKVLDYIVNKEISRISYNKKINHKTIIDNVGEYLNKEINEQKAIIRQRK